MVTEWNRQDAEQGLGLHVKRRYGSFCAQVASKIVWLKIMRFYSGSFAEKKIATECLSLRRESSSLQRLLPLNSRRGIQSEEVFCDFPLITKNTDEALPAGSL